MKLVYLPALILLFVMTSLTAADPIDNVANLIGQGNVAELSKLFTPTIELTMMEQEDTYSKRQAIDVLTIFFNQHKPRHIQLLHKVNSNKKYLFGVAILNSNNGSYRIAYTLNEEEGAMKIIELRIEAEKTK